MYASWCLSGRLYDLRAQGGQVSPPVATPGLFPLPRLGIP